MRSLRLQVVMLDVFYCAVTGVSFLFQQRDVPLVSHRDYFRTSAHIQNHFRALNHLSFDQRNHPSVVNQPTYCVLEERSGVSYVD